MSVKNDPEVCFFITNVFKPPKIFDFPETEQPFRFVCLKSFHGFVVLSRRMDPIVCLLLYMVIKVWENLYRNP